MTSDEQNKILLDKINKRRNHKMAIVKSPVRKNGRRNQPINQRKKGCGGCRRTKGIIRDAGHRK